MKKAYNQHIAEEMASNDRYRKNLLYHQKHKTFYLWRNGWYKKYDKDEMEEEIWRFLRDKFDNQLITAKMVGDIYCQLKWACLRKVKYEDKHLIAFKDKLFNTETFQVEEIDREKITFFYLPFNFDETKMDIPVFRQYLLTSIVRKDNPYCPDEDLIKVVQEMFGYFLMPGNLKGAAAWFLVGEGANGKSIMLDTIREIIGLQFVSAMSIQALTTDKFKSQYLLGKKVNIAGEEESKYIESSKFKAMITGDLIDAERKFGESFTFAPDTKFIFATNNMPTFNSIDYGIMRRMKILPFYRIFRGDDIDHNLFNKIKKEIPGIVGWALEGAKRLVENKYVYSDSVAIAESKKEFAEEVSSTVKFMRETYIVDDSGFVSNDEAYQAYKDWCSFNGKKPINKFSFLKDVARSDKRIEKIIKYIDGKTRRGYNLLLKPDDYVTTTNENMENLFHEDGGIQANGGGEDFGAGGRVDQNKTEQEALTK